VKLLQESQAEIWDTEAVYQEATFYFAGTVSADSCPKPEPREQRDLTLYTLYRSKKQRSTHIWLHVTSLAISFPQCYVTFFMFQFFLISLLCHPFPLLIIRAYPVCFSFGPPLCYIKTHGSFLKAQ
jgi:hypothetical protein